MGSQRKVVGLASLTETELKILKLVGEGLGNDEMAKDLFVSKNTIRSHVKSINSKLGFSSRLKLIVYAVKNLDCTQIAFFNRYELGRLGFPKSAMKFGVFKREKDDADHVVLILDSTGQLFKDKWRLEEIKP